MYTSYIAVLLVWDMQQQQQHDVRALDDAYRLMMMTYDDRVPPWRAPTQKRARSFHSKH